MSRKNRGNHKGTGVLPTTIADGAVLTDEQQALQDAADLVLAQHYNDATGLNFDDLSAEEQDRWIAENPLPEQVPALEESVEDEQAALQEPEAAPAPADAPVEGDAAAVTEQLVSEAPAADSEAPAEPVVEASAPIVDPVPEPTPAVEEVAAAPAVEEGQVPEAAVSELPVDPSAPIAPVEPEAPVGDDEAKPEQAEEPVVEAPTTTSSLRERLAAVLPADAVAAWDGPTLDLFDKAGAVPLKTSGGNWPVDIRRGKNLSIWDASELLDWAKGEIRTPEGVEEEAIFDEIYLRYKLPGNWTTEAAIDYVVNGKRPTYTKSGVLIEDRVRNHTPVSHWTYLELRSALLGDIESKFSPEELITQLRSRLGLNESYSAEKLLGSLAETPTEANMDNALLKAKLEEYKDIMTRSGANLTPATAGAAQGMLYKAIRGVMKRDMQSFNEGWVILLNWVSESYATLFTPERARRGWSHVQLSTPALATFEDLLTLMIHTRNPIGRSAAAKLYQLDQILRYVSNENERQNLFSFYAQ